MSPKSKSIERECSSGFTHLHQFDIGSYMLHMIDEFARFSIAVMMKSKTFKEFVEKFIKSWIHYFGYPKRLFLDNGGKFNSHLVREFGEAFNIKILTTAAYSPWSNGIVEQHNGILSLMVKKLKESFPDKGSECLLFNGIVMCCKKLAS